jgi:nucleotide-binding universal stress UspA family protein
VFDHLLLATDLSETSERATELAADLARAVRARVTVLHVFETSEAAAPAMALAAELTWPGAIAARAEIDRTVRRLRAQGVTAEGVLRFGLLPERIIETARDIEADLIVAGTHARKGLARLWHRSLAEHLLRHGPIPILAAGPRDADEVSSVPENVVQLRRR